MKTYLLQTKTFYILLTCFLLFGQNAYSHHTPTKYEKHVKELTTKSRIVVEAEVLSSTCFWDSDHRFIYTGHLVEVKTKLKGGEIPRTVEVVTLGGQVGSDRLEVTTSTNIRRGWKGLLFLGEAHVKGERKTLSNEYAEHSYSVLGQATYYYDNINPLSVLAGTVLKDIDVELIQKIEKLASQTRQIYDSSFQRPSAQLEQAARDFIESIELAPSDPTAASSSTTIEYLIDNPQITGTWPKYFEFDVSAKCNVSGTDFAKGEIWVNYNIDAFGPSIVGSGYLTWTEQSLIATGDYLVTANDETVDKVKLKVEHTGSLSTANLNDLPVIQEAMLHLKLRIDDLTQLANIIFEQDSMDDKSKFRGDGLHPYNTVIAVDPQIPLINGTGNQGLFLSMLNENVVEVGGEFWFEADVFARCSSDSTFFMNSHIFMNFNTNCFADLSLSAGNYEFVKVGLSDNPNVTIKNFLSNAPNGLLGIHVRDSLNSSQSPLGLPSDGVYVKPADQLLFKLRLRIENCNSLPQISFDEWNMVSNSSHRPILSPNLMEAYDPIEFPDSFNVMVCPDSIPVIYSFSPKSVSAGTRDTLTINGTNFGDSAVVWFRSAEDLSNTIYMEAKYPHYGIQADSVIKLAVPSIELEKNSAGTGQFLVRTTLGDTTWSDMNDPLEVRFSAWNWRDPSPGDTTVRRTLLINQDSLLNPPGNGGYIFYANDALYNDNDAFECAESSVAYWRCTTKVNFNLEASLSNNAVANDNINTISLLDSLTFQTITGLPLTGGTLALAWLKVAACLEYTDPSIPEFENLYYVKDIDILVNDHFSWNKDTSSTPAPTEFDLYSVLIHEVGHGVTLQHSLNSDDVMLPSIAPGTTQRVISAFDLEGGLYSVDLSSVEHWTSGLGTCPSFMLPDSTDCSGSPFGIEFENIQDAQWLVWPNPNSGQFKIKHVCSNQKCTVALFDISGKELLQTTEFKVDRPAFLDAGFLNSGTYILRMSCSSHVGTSLISVVK